MAMNWVEVDGAGLRYELSGGGDDTLVLIHEMGGTLESWDNVLPLLRGGTTVLRYDTRGAGQSTKLRGTGEMAVMVADIEALLQATGRAGRVVVSGGAVGGAIALSFAARRPERVRGVVGFGPATGIAAERRPAILAHADSVEAKGMPAIADAELARAYQDELRTDAKAFATYRARWLANDPGSYAAIYRMLAGLEMAADLAAIRCPALIHAGTKDPLRPPEMLEPIAKLIPNARFEPVETGHYAAWQTPRLVADSLNRFLAGLAA